MTIEWINLIIKRLLIKRWFTWFIFAKIIPVIPSIDRFETYAACAGFTALSSSAECRSTSRCGTASLPSSSDRAAPTGPAPTSRKGQSR